jgi:hypothetical protein
VSQLIAQRDPAVILARTYGERVNTGEGIALTVNRRSWSPGADEAAIVAGTLPAESVVLTADGRRYDDRGWHEGPEAEWIYVERWTAAGREFHGWIDSVSRRILQAG